MTETNKNAISPEGLARAEAELRELRDVRRAEIVRSIKSAREFGDLSENAEYHAAREAQGLNEARIRALEQRLAGAEVQA
ncbi:MAG: transcription elongation factor GreA, partial [Solirubrobacterales bacterium]|nr:transcription elongation factor GreA [Solirubrobacterales bacterium]